MNSEIDLSRTMPPAQTYDSRSADKFVVRFPEGMRSKLTEVAETNHRSMNSEAVMGLWWWCERQVLMESMLRATAQELARLQAMKDADIGITLDEITQRHPQTTALVQKLRALIGN
jgi:hypothetical protein